MWDHAYATPAPVFLDPAGNALQAEQPSQSCQPHFTAHGCGLCAHDGRQVSSLGSMKEKI